jgi:hypothetical protein
MAVVGYDKRSVGGSTGDWNTASLADLAPDVVAAFEYLKTRSAIELDELPRQRRRRGLRFSLGGDDQAEHERGRQ